MVGGVEGGRGGEGVEGAEVGEDGGFGGGLEVGGGRGVVVGWGGDPGQVEDVG